MVCLSPQGTPAVYRPRQPRHSPLYQLIERYSPEFQRTYDERYQQRYGSWRPIIGEVARKFLRCGDLLEPYSELTAEQLFERRWAITLLDSVLAELQRDYQSRGRAERFEGLRGFLQGERPEKYAVAARALGMTEEAVKQEVRRLRKRFGEALRQRIAETVASPEEIEDEIRHLFKSVAT